MKGSSEKSTKWEMQRPLAANRVKEALWDQITHPQYILGIFTACLLLYGALHSWNRHCACDQSPRQFVKVEVKSEDTVKGFQRAEACNSVLPIRQVAKSSSF